MSQTRWFSVIALVLLLAGKFAHAEDASVPPDGMFPGYASPSDAGPMPGRMSDMRDLLNWKKDHASDSRVQTFNQSHGDLPRPTPGEEPDPSQFQKIQQYMADLKALEKTVEASPIETVVPASQVGKVTVQQVERTEIKPALSFTASAVVQAPSKQETTSLCQVAASDVLAQLKDLQVQVVQLTAKLDAVQATPPHFADHQGLSSINPDSDPEVKTKMQERLVAQQIEQINDQTQDFKDQADDFKDKECPMPQGYDMDGPPGMDVDSEDSSPPRDGMDAFGTPPMDFDSKFTENPEKNGSDQQSLLLDLPVNLQSEIDSAKRDRTKAKSNLKTARRKWNSKCQKLARTQSAKKGGMPGMGMPDGNGMSQMGGIQGNGPSSMSTFGGLSQMQMMGGANSFQGGAGFQSPYLSQTPYQSQYKMGYSSPGYSYGYGSMGGMPSMMPNMNYSSMYNPYSSTGMGGYGGYRSPYYSMNYGYGPGYGSVGQNSYNSYQSPYSYLNYSTPSYSTYGSYGYGSYTYRGTSSYGSTLSGNIGLKTF